MDRIRVVVAGATGRVGREIVRAVARERDLQLVGAVARVGGPDAGEEAGIGPLGVRVESSLQAVLDRTRADVLVDFTRAEVAREHVLLALEHGVRPVVGTTGLSPGDLREVETEARRRGLGGAFIPNFALGAMLQMRFAEQAARVFPQVEIIELHHEAKVDRPSGTALRLAQRLEAAGARAPVPIHSVRVPGLVAHHEIIFGGLGQTLTLRHDSTGRESFVPGVLLVIRKVIHLDRVVFDLEDLVSVN